MAEEHRPLMHNPYVPIPDHLKTMTCAHHGCVPVAAPVTTHAAATDKSILSCLTFFPPAPPVPTRGTATDTGYCQAPECLDAVVQCDDARDAARWRWLVAHLPRDLTDLAELGIWVLTTVMYQGSMDIAGAVDCAMEQEGQP